MTSFSLQLKHFIDDTLINQINVKTTLSTSLHTSTVNHWWCPSFRGTAGDTSSRSRERNNRAVMPLDVPGRTRATLSAAVSLLGFLSIHANSFSRIGAKLWNEIWNSLPLHSLPLHIRETENLHNFKKKLKTLLLKNLSKTAFNGRNLTSIRHASNGAI